MSERYATMIYPEDQKVPESRLRVWLCDALCNEEVSFRAINYINQQEATLNLIPQIPPTRTMGFDLDLQRAIGKLNLLELVYLLGDTGNFTFVKLDEHKDKSCTIEELIISERIK